MNLFFFIFRSQGSWSLEHITPVVIYHLPELGLFRSQRDKTTSIYSIYTQNPQPCAKCSTHQKYPSMTKLYGHWLYLSIERLPNSCFGFKTAQSIMATPEISNTVGDRRRSGRPVTVSTSIFQQQVREWMRLTKGAPVRTITSLLKKRGVKSTSTIVRRTTHQLWQRLGISTQTKKL